MTNETQPKKPPEQWGTTAAKFYADAEGETIRLHLRGGESLTGVLVGVDTYNIFLEREDESVVLVAKHAVEWIERVGE